MKMKKWLSLLLAVCMMLMLVPAANMEGLEGIEGKTEVDVQTEAVESEDKEAPAAEGTDGNVEIGDSPAVDNAVGADQADVVADEMICDDAEEVSGEVAFDLGEFESAANEADEADQAEDEVPAVPFYAMAASPLKIYGAVDAPEAFGTIREGSVVLVTNVENEARYAVTFDTEAGVATLFVDAQGLIVMSEEDVEAFYADANYEGTLFEDNLLAVVKIDPIEVEMTEDEEKSEDEEPAEGDSKEEEVDGLAIVYEEVDEEVNEEAVANASEEVDDSEETEDEEETVVAKAIPVISGLTDVEGAVGQKVKFSAKVTGASSLQWQVKLKSTSDWVDITSTSYAGRDSEEMTFKVTAKNANYQYRLVAIDAAGNSTESNAVKVKLPLTIATQPVDVTGAVGTKVSFSAKVYGAASVQWQVKLNSNSDWTAITSSSYAGRDSVKMSFKVTEKNKAYSYRLVATDDARNTVTSNPVIVKTADDPLAIRLQPEDVTGEVGQKVSFSATVTGASSLQWQVKLKSTSDWANITSTSYAGRDSATMSFKVTEKNKTYQYRLVASDASGKKVESNAVKVKASEALAITKQPVDVEGEVGQKVSFSATVTGASSLQWQVKLTSTGDWTNITSTSYAGRDSAKMSFKVTEKNKTYQYRLVATDASGKSIESDEVSIITSKKVLNNVVYQLQGDAFAVIGYEGTNTAYTVVESIDGVAVKKIAEEAFMNNTAIVSIDLPDSIEVIGARAFKGCTNLSSMS